MTKWLKPRFSLKNILTFSVISLKTKFKEIRNAINAYVLTAMSGFLLLIWDFMSNKIN